MRNLFLVFTVVTIAGFVALTPAAQAKSLCGRFDRELKPVAKRLKAASGNGRWKQYEKFLKKFETCLDGGYAENVQDASQEGLANDWPSFVHYVTKENPNTDALKKMEGGFSITMGDPDLLKKIQKNANQNCPESMSKFCDKIKSAVLGGGSAAGTSAAPDGAAAPSEPASDPAAESKPQ